MRRWTGEKTREPGGTAWRTTSTIASVLALALLMGAPGARAEGSYDPAGDANSMYRTTQYTGAVDWWNAGYTGAGVDVALIDTGVSPVPGLDTPGKIVYGPDLSLESQASDLMYLDTNGHGTFMAGLIAGKDPTLTAPYADAPASAYRGMAPDARIVSLKVGVADGGVDVSQVIAAIDWVVQHRNDDGLNIRVINLSYGTNTPQLYSVDPLAHAVEHAWNAGIVVVAATGNTGYQRRLTTNPGLANPAYDPYVIAVGASDSNGTLPQTDDLVAEYSARSQCKGCRNPDFIAPGAHLQGLRVPNSYIDSTHPEGLLGDRYFRGSGTSESAAIVSGAVALLLQKDPSLTPDQVKYLLRKSVVSLPGSSVASQGQGEITLAPILTKRRPSWVQSLTPSTGTGSLELSRGTDHIAMDGVLLTGEQDIMGSAFDSVAMAALRAQGKSWSGGDWNGKSWSGNAWTAKSWSSDSWSAKSWSAKSWSGESWSGKSWSSCLFSGASWSGASWSGASWSGASWSGASWSGGSWATGSWS